MAKAIMYEQIYRDLLSKITQGEYQAGDRLPSEMELAAIYGVSRITTQKSMDLLAKKHYITRTPGRGSFVNTQVEAELDAQMEQGADQVDRQTPGKMIAVIFDTFGSDFGSGLLKSMEQECTRLGYDMLFKCTYGSIEKENEAIQGAMRAGAKGIILMCAQGENYNSTVLRLALNGFPLVLVDRPLNGIPIPCIKTDNYTAAGEVTRMLIGKGHEKICFVTHAAMTTMTIHARYEGFVDCVMEYEHVSGSLAKIESYNHAPEDTGREYGEFHEAEMERLVLQNQECTAFLAVEYRLGILLARCLKAQGSEREIAVFDGIEAVYEEDGFLHVRQNEHEMGRQALLSLLALMEGRQADRNIDIPYLITSQNQ